MVDIESFFIRSIKYILFLLAIYMLAWGFTPYPKVFLGLALGTSFSLYNLWVFVRKFKRIQQTLKEGRSVRSLGTASRMAAAGLAVIIALKFPEYFHLIGVVIGLMTMYVVIIINSILNICGQAWEER